jgi:hypothetical protein
MKSFSTKFEFSHSHKNHAIYDPHMGAISIRRNSIRRVQFVAINSSHNQFVADQFIAHQFVAMRYRCG